VLFIYARVRRLCFPDAPASGLSVCASIRPDGSGVQSALAPLPERGCFGCSETLALRTIPTRDHQICFSIKRSADGAELARIALPLAWFPSGKVVSAQFAIPPATGNSLIAVDVHVTGAEAAPFQAPPGELRVMPTPQVGAQALNSRGRKQISQSER
jgi:hypothetical protein